MGTAGMAVFFHVVILIYVTKVCEYTKQLLVADSVFKLKLTYCGSGMSAPDFEPCSGISSTLNEFKMVLELINLKAVT